MRNEENESKDLQEKTGMEIDTDNIFSIEEIKIEEMAIDGICGVY